MKQQGDILIIEDESTFRLLLTETLKGEGFGVRETGTGEGALAETARRTPDLILLDLILPGLSGFEVLKRLKAAPATRDTPIIILSAMAETEDRVKGLQLGAVDYIVKPCVRAELAAKVKAHLELRRAHKELQKRSAKLEKLTRALLGLGSDYGSNLAAMTRLCAELLDADCTMYNRLEGDEFNVLAASGDCLPQRRMKAEGTPCLEVLRAAGETRGLAFNDLSKFINASCMAGKGFKSYFGHAVKFTGGTGVICALFKHEYAPREEYRMLIGLVASAIATEESRRSGEEERGRLSAAIEQAGEAVVITDRAGLIQYVNPAFENITGYSRAEALGQNPRLLKSGRQDAAFYKQLWETISAGRIWKSRMVNRRKDGSFYTEDATVSAVRGPSGEIENFVAVKKDISEQLLVEEQLMQAQKMEAVGLLAGGIAHDFNNILTAVKCYAQVIARELSPDSPAQSDSREILAAAERGEALTRQLLAFSRKQVMSPVRTDLNSIVSGMSKMLRRVIGENIALDTRLHAEQCPVFLDPVQLEQAILNLVINARDAISGRGVITLETGMDKARGSWRKAVGTVYLKVRDTGCGISPEVRRRLFEPFFTTKGPGRGSGLGLPSVLGIVKQSEGEIEVHSEPGQGATFTLYFPMSAAPAAEEPGSREKTAQAQLTGSGTVLLVEDEEPLLRLGLRMLKAAGFTVIPAASGEDALKAAEAHGKPVDLLLTDVVLPGISGRELARALVSRGLARRVLYMSGYTDREFIRDGKMQEGVAFIQKPFDVDAISEKIRKVLEGPPGQSRP